MTFHEFPLLNPSTTCISAFNQLLNSVFPFIQIYIEIEDVHYTIPEIALKNSDLALVTLL